MASSSTRAVVVLDRVAEVLHGMSALAARRVMVGIPADNAARREGAVTNAALGYIHENGSAEVGIPARPWLVPGVKRAQPETIAGLKRAGELALEGRGDAAVERQLGVVGTRAVNSVKATLTEGVPPPLKDATIKNRLRGRGTKSRRKGELAELAARASGAPPSLDVKPLIDTGQLLRSVTYVIRGPGNV